MSGAARAYRKLLLAIKTADAPPAAAKALRNRAKTALRAVSSAELDAVMADIHKRLDFVVSITPKRRTTVDAAEGVSTFVVRDGDVVDGDAARAEAAGHSGWYEGNLNPEAVQRHVQQMRRFHFMDRN
jgi:hypothetical protein